MKPINFTKNSSWPVNKCQVCQNKQLKSIIFLGYLPPVNQMIKIGSILTEQPSYPAELLYCSQCNLVQLGLIVNPEVLFPKEYPYTSSTTKVLRDNFAELYQESNNLLKLNKDDLILDIGSNDGNLLINFKENHRVLGITPEDIGKLAIKKGIPTIIDYFDKHSARKIKADWGKAKVVTATNVFAHIENVNQVVENILNILKKDGVFISESHYLYSLLKTLQYDTIYHEHLRYYSLKSLNYLFEMHGLEIFHAKLIPTHGGSIRVYAVRKGQKQILPSVKKILKMEEGIVDSLAFFSKFKAQVLESKLELFNLLRNIKKARKKIYGISAPSRGSTLVNYLGLDEGILDCILEVSGSYKIGKYLPGTIIPILEESKLYSDQPDFVLLLSWHISDELIPKLKKKGFKGKFIVPLPDPKIVD